MSIPLATTWPEERYSTLCRVKTKQRNRIFDVTLVEFALQSQHETFSDFGTQSRRRHRSIGLEFYREMEFLLKYLKLEQNENPRRSVQPECKFDLFTVKLYYIYLLL